jgi:hypothetical protein
MDLYLPEPLVNACCLYNSQAIWLWTMARRDHEHLEDTCCVYSFKVRYEMTYLKCMCPQRWWILCPLIISLHLSSPIVNFRYRSLFRCSHIINLPPIRCTPARHFAKWDPSYNLITNLIRAYKHNSLYLSLGSMRYVQSQYNLLQFDRIFRRTSARNRAPCH